MDVQVQFDAAERAAILADYDRKARPHGFERHAWVFRLFYVFAALSGVLTVLVAWKLRGRVPSDLVLGMAVLTAMLVLLGAIPPLFVRGLYSSEAYGRAEGAIERLRRDWPGGPAGQLRAAALDVLLHSFYSSGAWGRNVFDAEGARRRLGEAFGYVEAVERLLRQERRIAPVFTGIRESDAPARSGRATGHG